MAEGNVYARMSAVLSLDNREFLTKLERTTKKLGAFSKKTERLGKSLTRNLSLPLALVGAAAAKLAVDFEKQLATVAAVSGATSKELESLRKNALQLGASTVFSATQVAQLQEELARLGFSATEITGVTESILALAQATGTDLAEAASIVGTAIRSFSLSTGEAAHVADVFALATANSALSMETLKESFSEFAPLAASLGLSIEQTSGLLAVLADRGIKGSKAGNALKAVFAGLAKSGADFNDTIESVRSGAIGFDEAMELVGRRGATALLALGQVSDKELRTLVGQFENAEGAALGMAAIMDDTAFGSLKALQSATQGLGISLGDALKPLLESITKSLTSFARTLDGLTPRQKRFASALGLALAALGPMLLLTSKLSKGLASLTKTYQAQLGAIIAHNEAKRQETASTAAAAAGTVADTAGKTANAAATNVATTASMRFAAALRTVRAALASTGIGLLVVGLGVIAERFLAAAGAADEAKGALNEWDKVQNRIEESTAAVAARLEGLVEAFGEYTDDAERQAAVLRQIGDINSDLVDGLEAGVTTQDELNGKVEEYIALLRQQARVQAATNLLNEAQEESVRLELASKDVERLLAGEELSERQIARIEEVFGDREGFAFRGERFGVRALIEEFTKDGDIKGYGRDVIGKALRRELLGPTGVFKKAQDDVALEIDALEEVIQEGTEQLGSGIKVEGTTFTEGIQDGFEAASDALDKELLGIDERLRQTGDTETALKERQAAYENYFTSTRGIFNDGFTRLQELEQKSATGDGLTEKEQTQLDELRILFTEIETEYGIHYDALEDIVKQADLVSSLVSEKEKLELLKQQLKISERRARAEQTIAKYTGETNADSKTTQAEVNRERQKALGYQEEILSLEEDMVYQQLLSLEAEGNLLPMEAKLLEARRERIDALYDERNAILQNIRLLKTQLANENFDEFLKDFGEGKGSTDQLVEQVKDLTKKRKELQESYDSLEIFDVDDAAGLLSLLESGELQDPADIERLKEERKAIKAELDKLTDEQIGKKLFDAAKLRIDAKIDFADLDRQLENGLITPLEYSTEKASRIYNDWKNDLSLVDSLRAAGYEDLALQLESLIPSFEELTEKASQSDEAVGNALESMTADNKERANRIGLMMQGIAGAINLVSEAYLSAAQSGESFGETLKKAMRDAVRAIVVQILTLIALFLALAVAIALATGGMNLKAAGKSLGKSSSFFGGMANFVSGGLGGGPIAKSADVSGGGADGSPKLALVVRGTDLHTASVGANNSSRRLYGE